MPINQIPTFDPFNEDSWFFGFMSRADATKLLASNEEIGAFLVRESTTAKGDLVLSVKESDDKVSHYIINRILYEKEIEFKIGEQFFKNIPDLLMHYRTYNLDETALKVPAYPKDPKIPKRSFTRDYLAEVPFDLSLRSTQTDQNKVVTSSMQRKLPGLAKVIQSRIPNAYDKTALTLREGDIVKVTKTDISGCWEGEVSGRKGHFPFNYVKFIEDSSE